MFLLQARGQAEKAALRCGRSAAVCDEGEDLHGKPAVGCWQPADVCEKAAGLIVKAAGMWSVCGWGPQVMGEAEEAEAEAGLGKKIPEKCRSYHIRLKEGFYYT